MTYKNELVLYTTVIGALAIFPALFLGVLKGNFHC